MNHDTRLHTALEYIGQQGCDNVRQVIGALEHGSVPQSLQDLDRHERNQLLSELKGIMAVYDRPGRSPKTGAED